MLKRKPVTLVEIDLPYCTRSFGVGLCGASMAAAQQRTNSALWSQEFDNAWWTKLRATITANAAVAPDGTTTADRLVDDTAAGPHLLFRANFAFTSGVVYAMSGFFKSDTLGQFMMQLGNGGTPFPTATNWRALFDLTTGSIVSHGANVVASMVALGGGWYRCGIVGTAQASANDAAYLAQMISGGTTNYTGTGNGAIFVWGAQIEVGDSISAYKATTDATVTEWWGGAARKCFNSRATCSYAQAYDAGTKTVTFSHNQDGIPDMPGLFPALKSVSSRPGELNLSGFDPRSNALGVRARVTVNLQDFTSNDTWLDKYQSERVSGAALASGVGYNPLTRGRFLARMFERFPYYNGLPMRVRRGYVGDTPATMPTENYVISELTGPNAAGEVQITAKDVLDLADNKKAVYPRASNGKLLDALAVDATTATLTPAGIGSEYPSSGRVRIGREIMGFTRSGDVLTLTRGAEGTTAQAANALDLVQICGVLDGLTFNQAIETILTDKQPEFAQFIDSAAWQAEHDTWLSGSTIGRVIISKPAGKAKLIGEICQLGVLVWWDAIAQEIRYRANAPLAPGETYVPITDEAGLITGTPDVDRAEDVRTSAVWIYHGVRDWTDEALASRNFDKLAIATVAENLYGQESYKEIFTRWFGRAGDETSAGIIVERLLARYKRTPRVVSGVLDVKDRAQVNLGARVQIESYVLQDVDGATLAVPMQVNYAEYTDDRVKFRAEEYRLDGRFAFWMDDGTAPADYASATDAQKATGAFWGDETQATFPDGTSQYVWF